MKNRVILFWVFGQKMEYGEVVRKNVGFDFMVYFHDSWVFGWISWGNFDGDILKICGRMFMSGRQSCRGIGLRVGCVEQKMHKFEIIGLFHFEDELW